MKDLNHLYQQQPALYEHDFDYRGFEWVEVNDVEQSVFAYMRFAEDHGDFVVVVCNFTPVVRHNYRIGVPHAGYYRELLNSDATAYSGSGVGNLGGAQTEPIAWHVHGQSLNLTLPPLAILVLKLDSAIVPVEPVETAIVPVDEPPTTTEAN
jgi:1,4-alpha-glucan branching enzyme